MKKVIRDKSASGKVGVDLVPNVSTFIDHIVSHRLTLLLLFRSTVNPARSTRIPDGGPTEMCRSGGSMLDLNLTC